MPLSTGTRMGPYEIVAPLGAGGMGEVYRARDTRLGREVALKILPDEVANDSSRRQRFEVEARAVAALNHPNIVSIYDVGEGYIISELVDGASLRGLKPGLRRTTEIGAQIAEGLAAAHGAGITHRDLKPENILLTREGRVKILDFGLAKMTGPKGAAATETVTVATDSGTVVGTVGYMSPEQVRGQQVDHRSDIFNLGLILHELLTGERAFRGETTVDTMQAILRQDPPELPATVPAGLRQVIGHCVEKEPGNRFQSARDLAFALSAMTHTGSQAVVAVPSPRSRGWLRPAAAVVAFGALAIFALWPRPKPAPRWTGVLLGGPDFASTPKISPDGHLLAFLTIVDEVIQVGVMKIESGDYTILTRSTEHGFAGTLAWSPDGSRLYYDRWTDVPRGIYSVPVLGGPEQLVLEDAAAPDAVADGSLLLARYNKDRQFQLFRFWPETGRLQAFPIEIPDNAYASPHAFPDGQEAVVAGTLIGPGREEGRQIQIVDLRTGGVRRLVPTADRAAGNAMGMSYGLNVTRDGKTVMNVRAAGNTVVLDAISRDGHTMAAVPLALTSGSFSLDTGPNGSLYLDQSDRPVQVLRFAANSAKAETLATLPPYEAPGSPWGDGENFAMLPDGRAAVTLGTGGRLHLMLIEAGKPAARLVNTPEETSAPVAAVGAAEVAFLIGADRDIGIATVANGRVVRRIPLGKGRITALAASPDGKTLYCAAGGTIWSIPREGGEAKPVRAGDHVAADPSGHYLVVQVTESPVIRLVRVPLDGAPEQELKWADALRPAFLITPNAIGRDGRILMPLGTPAWYWPAGVLDPAAGRLTRLPVDKIVDFHALGWTPDGKVMGLGLEMRSRLWKFSPEK